ncbi:hypothetical protein [Clostridium neonatale]|nr:hypothetical protein [Clostridium neonatale]CAI3207770.1 hypothetical protein CNEO2_360044 [Clostridium neonatale]
MKKLKKTEDFLDEYSEYYSNTKFDWFGAIKILLEAIVTIFLFYLVFC